MVQYTSQKNLPYPVVGDGMRIASRDLRDLAWGVDAELAATESTLAASIRDTEGRVDSTAATLRVEMAAQLERFEQLLSQLETAYDVAVENGFTGTPAQWLESLRGDQGPEGPYGGTSVTDPQVAAMVSSDTETAVALKQHFVERHGTRGQTRTIYVRTTGDDTNDGTSPDNAYREIRAAVNALADEGPVIRGSVRIDVGPGVYEGGIRLPSTRGVAQDDFIRVVGTRGEDGVPTTLIRHTAGTGTGFLGEDGSAVWLEDLKFTGGFGAAVQITRNVYAWFVNVHVDGENVGVRGFSISSHARYYVRGGLIENMVYAGIDEYFNVARSYATVSSAADQLVIRNCRIGLRAKEGCIGHLDFLNVEDCETGLEFIQNSVANLKGVVLKRNQVALALVNSTVHNEGGIQWGTGDDANQREVYSVGASGELRAIGWTGEDMAPGSSIGHRPLFVIGNDFTEKTITGTTGTEIELSRFQSSLPRAFFRTVGKRFKIQVFARVDGASSSSPVSVIARIGTTLLTSVELTNSGVALIEIDVICTEDRTSHLIRSTSTIEGHVRHTVRRSSTMLAGDPNTVSSVNLFTRLNTTGQSFTLYAAEMFG